MKTSLLGRWFKPWKNMFGIWPPSASNWGRSDFFWDFSNFDFTAALHLVWGFQNGTSYWHWPPKKFWPPTASKTQHQIILSWCISLERPNQMQFRYANWPPKFWPLTASKTKLEAIPSWCISLERPNQMQSRSANYTTFRPIFEATVTSNSLQNQFLINPTICTSF